MTEVGTGTLIGGRYRLEHNVGEGGMGSVWVAEDDKLHRWVAVKVLGPRCASSPSVRERFEREALALGKLRSPHVVQVFDYGTDEQAGAYMVMELLNGQDLYSWLRAHRPAPLGAVTRIILQAAKGLGAAHRAGIVHRDLKPANIFVAKDHEEEVVKIFDFGLAKGLSDIAPLRDRTGEGVLLGTPRYMSPEQAHGARSVDHRADLWSLGVIAYLAITGRLPFRGSGVGEVITKISTEPPLPPSQLVAGLPPAVDVFFARALAKDPDDRFQTAQQLADALRALAPDAMSSGDLVPLVDADTMLDAGENDTRLGHDEEPSDEPGTLGDPDTELSEGPADSTLLDVPDSLENGPTRHAAGRPSPSLWARLGPTLVAAAAIAALLVLAAIGRRGASEPTGVPGAGGVATIAPVGSVAGSSAPVTTGPATTESPAVPATDGGQTMPGPIGPLPHPTTQPSTEPTASASSGSSDRGLELFVDRH